MPRATQIWTKLIWNGGINSAVDPGVLPDNDLVQADNVIFATSGARIKREGLDFFDALSAIPSIATRSSSGTTRTLVFSESVNSATNEKLVIGEAITIATSAGGAEDAYAGNFTVATITTTTSNNDTITYTAGSSLSEGATATSTLTATRNFSIIGMKDYWRTSLGSKKQLLVAATSQGKIFRYDSAGRRTEVNKDAGATALLNPTRASFEVINETLIIAFNGATNTPKKYNPDTSVDWFDLGGSPPNFEVVSEYLGRLFSNDKDDPDRLHYSTTGNPEEWNGSGDSGAIDIFPGDGDPEGIIAISPPFKDRIFIGKKNKIIQLLGKNPEDFQPVPITNGLGMTSQRAIIPIDLDDVMFISDKGFHSLLATNAQGDFQATFLSSKIQNDFNDFAPSRISFTSGAYIPSINSVAFSIAPSGSSVQSEVWLFNTQLKEWYKWPEISCQALASRLVDEREERLIFGTNAGRIIQAQNGLSTDFGSQGITYTVKSGAIYPDNNPQALKMFKRFTFYFKPKADFTFDVTYQIDNQVAITETISQAVTGDLLGSTFILGSSLLGFAGVFAPSTIPIDGIGRGLTLTVTDSTTGQPIELYGVGIEFEQADINQERI